MYKRQVQGGRVQKVEKTGEGSFQEKEGAGVCFLYFSRQKIKQRVELFQNLLCGDHRKIIQIYLVKLPVFILAVQIKLIDGIDLRPVSYTHLDVYKRQG